jgi:general nucleoside transport system permease protein
MSADTAAKPVEPPEPAERKPSLGTLFARYLTEANSVMVTVYSLLLAFAVGAILIVVSDDAVRSSWGYFFARPGDDRSESSQPKGRTLNG